MNDWTTGIVLGLAGVFVGTFIGNMQIVTSRLGQIARELEQIRRHLESRRP